MPAASITDPDDPRVADFRRLNDSSFRRQIEQAGPFHKGLFIIEGWLGVERLLPSRYALRSVLVDVARLERATELLGPRAPLMVADRAVLDEIVGFPLHRGIVASAERGLPLLATDVSARARRLVVLEGVNDAENMGSIIRNAVALGGDGLLLDPSSCDPLSRRAVRVSVGHALALPFSRLAWPDGLAALHQAGVHTVALTPSATHTIDELDLPADSRVAVVFGAEGPGLSETALESCAHRARIPMARDVDSLNVASAAAIACHRLFGAV